MYEPPYSGYPSLVWAGCYQALTWLTQLLNSTSTPSQIDDPTWATFWTLRNGIEAISVWQAGIALTNEHAALVAVQALPFQIDTQSLNYIDARVLAVEAAGNLLQELYPPLTPTRICVAASLLDQGEPVIPDPGFIEWCMNFNTEIPPTGATLPADAQTMANSWLNVANAINSLQGGTVSTQYDTAARQYRCCQVIANNINALQSGPFSGAVNDFQPQLFDSAGNPLLDSNGNPLYSSALSVNPYHWNQVLALPTILLNAATLTSHPASAVNQQAAVIKHNLIIQLYQLAALMLALRVHYITQPVTDTLRNGESLADLAARDLGNFDAWPQIANINSLQPPYPGPTNQALALSGQELFLTSPGVIPDPDAQAATYMANVLGVDWSWGDLNGPQLAWNGDLNLIAGYKNFSQALGRRIQTPLGALIYHRAYGSLIPPEVGAVQTADEAARLLQYGNSAVLADPRTATILSSTATTQPGFLATYSAVVQPVGPNANSIATNATIGARP